MALIELIIAAIFFVILALVLSVCRLGRGPHVVDRAVAADTIETMSIAAMALFALYSGRGIYLDIAIVIALLGFVSTVLISRYLEGRL